MRVLGSSITNHSVMIIIYNNSSIDNHPFIMIDNNPISIIPNPNY